MAKAAAAHKAAEEVPTTDTFDATATERLPSRPR